MRRPLLTTLLTVLLLMLVLSTVLSSVVGAGAQDNATPTPTTAPAAGGAGTSGGSDEAAENTIKIGKAHPAESFPERKSDKPIFILVLGSDARSRQASTIARGRSDSIHIIGINPKKGRASILGFPRDAWVDIPGHGKNKINDAMYYGGPEGAVAMIESLTGMRMDYYALAGFYDFRGLVSEIGGINVDIPYDINDPHVKYDFKKGHELLTGKKALEFNRARYDVPGGDFGRSENQGLFLVSMLRDYRRAFAKDPSTMYRWFTAMTNNIQTDIKFDELLDLAFTITKIDAATVTNQVVPGSIGQDGGESIVNLSSSARSIYADMAADGLIGGK